jgi:SAM-dependent methyltransferase
MSNEAFAPLYCGRKFSPIHPSPDMSPKLRELWSYFTDQLRWASHRITSRVTFDFLVNAADFAKNKPILDAGAGHQRYKPFFSECVYFAQEHPEGIAFKQMGEIEYDFGSPIDLRIPVKDRSFACVLNTSVLEHVRHPEKFIAEAYRVLCPGGRLYMHVPFSYVEHEQPYDFQRPSRYGLSAWLKSAGFSKVSVLPSSNSCYGSSWFYLQAVESELLARGAEQMVRNLSPILKHCIDSINDITDDYIDADATMPVGWISVAEKEGDIKDYSISAENKEVLKSLIMSHDRPADTDNEPNEQQLGHR